MSAFTMNKNHLLIIFLSVLFLSSCKDELSYTAGERTIEYDVFPVIGQSNVYKGYGADLTTEKTDPRIKQLGRFGAYNYQVIEAKEPLQHVTIASGCNGFAMTFALNYLRYYWQGNREVLLIPGALDGSSFYNRQWNKGDSLYNDIVARTKYVLDKYPGSKVRGILWHQGESDVYWGRDYAGMLDRMITNMRKDIAGDEGKTIPFIVGGMLPHWVNSLPARKITDSVIRETPLRLPAIGYANPNEPFVIEKPDYLFDDIHFDASGQRILGERYFEAYQKVRR